MPRPGMMSSRGPDIARWTLGDEVFARSPTGSRRQTGKNAVLATNRFYSIYIAGFTWGVSRDFETMINGYPPRSSLANECPVSIEYLIYKPTTANMQRILVAMREQGLLVASGGCEGVG